MNTKHGRAKPNNFRILLDSGCSSTIVMRRIFGKLYPEKDAVMQWHTQAGSITTNHKVKEDFTLTAFSATNVVTCKCHVYDSAKGGYNSILGQDL